MFVVQAQGGQTFLESREAIEVPNDKGAHRVHAFEGQIDGKEKGVAI